MDNNKRLIVLSVTGVLILIVGVVNLTYSWFSTLIEGTGEPIIVTTGILDIKYEETENMNVTFAEAIYDDNRATQAYKNVFTISHEERSNIDACYSIDLSIDSIQDKFKSEWIKYELYDVTNNVSITGIKDFSEVVGPGIIPLASNLSLVVNDSVQYELRIWLSYSDTVDQTSLLQNNSGTAISAHMKVSAVNGKCPDTLYAQILEDNPNVETRSRFDTIFTESNNGNTIYSASGQDGKITYYFAGTVTNNYVKFGTNSSGQELWWRIVRINEDNSVRLIYAGTSATDTAAFISSSQVYNTDYNKSIYAGYMYSSGEQYGTTENSSIKEVVDAWYQTNLLNNYDGYISRTAIYCNDRTVANDGWSESGANFNYNTYERVVTNKNPVFNCDILNDRFTASETVGNGALTYPIGLITADEILFAGGTYGTANSNYYIAQNASSGASYWWTMSADYWYNNFPYVLRIGGYTDTGGLSDNNVYNGLGVRPVISLKACVLVSGGDGTASNPYVVGISNACSSAEN